MVSAIQAPLTREWLENRLDAIAQSDKPLKELSHLTRTIPLAPLQRAIGVDAIAEAQRHFLEAQHYLAQNNRNLSPSLRTRLSNTIDHMMGILENFVDAFGIASFFQPSKNEWHANMKESKLMSLFYAFGSLSSILLPVLGAELAGACVGGALLSIAGLSLIFEKIRPPSTYLPRGDNWTREYRNGALEVGEARKPTLDRVAKVLISAQTKKRFPLLIGPSGIGKTEVIKSLVEAIERGDYPELQGKTVVYFNTANLLQHYDGMGGGNTILKQIRDRMGRHADRFILVFDEIHNLEKRADDHSPQILGEQLKTLLDPGSHGYPYVIGLTTQEDFDATIARNRALVRRFEQIPVTRASSPETVGILQNAYLRHAPHLHLAPDALPHLAAAIPADAPQPGRSLEVFARCLERASDSQETRLDRRIVDLRTQLDLAITGQAAGDRQANLPALEQQLATLEAEATVQEAALKKFYAQRRTWVEIKTETARTTLAVSKKATEQNQTALLLLQQLGRTLGERLRTEATRLGIQTEITRALVDAELV